MKQRKNLDFILCPVLLKATTTKMHAQKLFKASNLKEMKRPKLKLFRLKLGKKKYEEKLRDKWTEWIKIFFFVQKKKKICVGNNSKLKQPFMHGWDSFVSLSGRIQIGRCVLQQQLKNKRFCYRRTIFARAKSSIKLFSIFFFACLFFSFLFIWSMNGSTFCHAHRMCKLMVFFRVFVDGDGAMPHE